MSRIGLFVSFASATACFHEGIQPIPSVAAYAFDTSVSAVSKNKKTASLIPVPSHKSPTTTIENQFGEIMEKNDLCRNFSLDADLHEFP